MTLMVTGAAGFIGSNLVKLLAKHNFQIKAVDCFLNDSYDSNLKK
jgi:nucleoside-diphosphate-sugar epimerase